MSNNETTSPQLTKFAGTTDQTKKDSMRHFLKFIQRNNSSYTSVDQLSTEDVTSAGGMESYFLALGSFLVFDLKKTVKRKPDSPYAIGSLLQYVAGIKDHLINKPPFFPLFGTLVTNSKTKSREPLWYGAILGSVSKGYNTHWVVDDFGGDIKLKDDPDEVIYREELGEHCSTYLICSKAEFLKKAGDRNMLGLLLHCIGRGGEVKPLRWTGSMGCRWDKKLSCLVLWWKEQKVIRCYPLAIIADAKSYKCCTLSGFAVFACAGGLGRTEEELKHDSANMIFPNLARIGNAAVTTKISNLLPGKLTAKALRRGGIGEAQFHQDTTQHDVTFRSGHVQNDNTSKYTCPSAGASRAAAMALTGYVNVRASVYYPEVPRGMLAKQQ
jgi:hypothetical protein